MAEAVLQIALDNLYSLIQNEVALFLGFDEELKRLSSILTAIKATLEDAEEKQFSNRAIKDWLQKLKDVAHALDDLLDECATQALELEFQGFNCGSSHKVQSSCLSSFHPNHVVFRRKTAKKMKRISERLDQIAEERIKFHLTEKVTERRTGVVDGRQSISIITEPLIYGRDEDRDTILDFLVVDASGFEDLSVYPIVGLGGLGKTTLAQLIFTHERVVNHFELRIWVCVSEDFSLKRMMKAIMESASGDSGGDMDLEPLRKKLQDLLQQKRYLLVLDDVWDDQQENWQRLKSVLACGAKGASVLVTTRLSKVAEIMKTVPPHDLSLLSDDDCWELFKQRAFGPDEVEREDLVIIGKEIVKKCRGVPLAAKALGALLRLKREVKQWLYVKESQLWSLQDEDSVMPALRLSYLNLPVKLRQCFAFCALFPKDTEIEKQFLIELWVANGFVSSDQTLDAEDIGDDVWHELYWRSLFQDIQTDEFCKITSFKMHDLVHDLAQSVAEEVCCITDDNNNVTSTPERIRHLSTYGQKSFGLHEAKALKTCIERYYYCDGDQLPSQVLKCYSLRVLQSRGLSYLSASIGHLKHLRYLDVSGGRFETLPESLCRIWNLQILKLDRCYNLKKLPNSLIQLKALQHLSLMDCFSLTSLPPQIGKMTSLRTLSMYFVSKERGFLLAELGRLNLKGVLHIKNLERVKSVTDAKDANMSSKQLNTLWLSWGRNEESELQENVEQILEVLQPHTQQLQTLLVGGYPGARFPQWMSSPSLKYLNFLRLMDCKSCLHLPQLGKLPSLKSLCIYKMSRVMYLQEKSYDGGVAISFMALEFLLLEELPNLIRLSSEDGENMFPRLSKLQITECPKLLGLPCLPSLSDLRIKGKCNQDLLSSIHKLGSLESLCFRTNEELTCFPDGMLRNLTSLKKVDIYELSRVEVLPIEMAIQELYIEGCDSLKSLTDEVLQGSFSLKILHIGRCRKFKLSAGFQYLTCLEKLTIERFPEVEDLREALQHMTVLQSLALCDLPNLGSLPDCLGNLGLLHTLIISECPKLKCLPMSIQRLSCLKALEIHSCHELGNRCQKETGEDWPKIAHLQHIQIDEYGFSCARGGSYYGCLGDIYGL